MLKINITHAQDGKKSFKFSHIEVIAEPLSVNNQRGSQKIILKVNKQ